MAQGRQVSQGTMAARYGSAARLGRIYVSVGRGPHDAGGGFRSGVDRRKADFAGEVGADAQDSEHTSLLPGCLAHPGKSRRTGVSAGLAGVVAIHLSRRTRSGACETAFETGLPVPHNL